MGAVAALIPQVFFDLYARYIPGLVLLGAWILLLGQESWRFLLNAVLGGQLDSTNALPIATLTLLFVPLVIGYVMAPLAKLVQRGNEHGWWLLRSRPSRSVYEESGKRWWQPKDWWVLKDEGAGEGYDYLRADHPKTGAYVAKIRAEFTMHNALAVAFAAIAVVSWRASEPWWVLASLIAAPLMAHRGAKTEGTFHKTTRKLCKEKQWGQLKEKRKPRLIWLMPTSDYAHESPLWQDSKGWLAIGPSDDQQRSNDDAVRLDRDLLTRIREWGSDSGGGKRRAEGRDLVRALQAQMAPDEFRLAPRWVNGNQYQQ